MTKCRKYQQFIKTPYPNCKSFWIMELLMPFAYFSPNPSMALSLDAGTVDLQDRCCNEFRLDSACQQVRLMIVHCLNA